MFGFMRKKRQEQAASESSAEVVRDADHAGANVRDTILANLLICQEHF